MMSEIAQEQEIEKFRYVIPERLEASSKEKTANVLVRETETAREARNEGFVRDIAEIEIILEEDGRYYCRNSNIHSKKIHRFLADRREYTIFINYSGDIRVAIEQEELKQHCDANRIQCIDDTLIDKDTFMGSRPSEYYKAQANKLKELAKRLKREGK